MVQLLKRFTRTGRLAEASAPAPRRAAPTMLERVMRWQRWLQTERERERAELDDQFASLLEAERREREADALARVIAERGCYFPEDLSRRLIFRTGGDGGGDAWGGWGGR